MSMQSNWDIIRHSREACMKFYDKKIVNDKDKYIIRWKSFEKYQHVKNEDEYHKCQIRKGKTWGKWRNHDISNSKYDAKEFVIQDM